MIHSFTCKNFYSFKEEAGISFKVDNNAPVSNDYFVTPSGTRLSKVCVIVGSNASGKTNLLKILPFLKYLIVDAFNSKPDNPIAVRPFAFGASKNKPTSLSVTFEIEKNIYTYKFVVASDRILKEELKMSSFVKKKKSTKKLFSRKWNQRAANYDFDGRNFGLPKGFDVDLLRANSSVIGITSRLNHAQSRLISTYWSQIETNVTEAGWIGDRALADSIVQLGEAFHFFYNNAKLKKEAETLLRQFDLGLNGFEIQKEEKESDYTLKARSLQMFEGQLEHLPIHYVSSGTKQLFVLLKSILVALEQGAIAVLDEFDVNLHPDMVIALYNLFIQSETNRKNAQVLLSTHSHILLSKLDKYQIILIEKNKDGISESWRLDEMSGVRSDENYYAKYIAGAYGAVPRI